MESEVRKLFWSLHKEVLYLFYRWKIYRQLFDSGADNLKLLNQSGSNVFALLHNLIMDDVFLTLCRLTDPVKTNGKTNLSLRYFLGKASTLLTDELRKDLKRKFTRLDKLTNSVRDHRKRRIAHLDLRYASEIEALPPVMHRDLDDSLKLLNSVMRDLHVALFNADTNYQKPAIAYGCDGDYLLRVLRDAHAPARVDKGWALVSGLMDPKLRLQAPFPSITATRIPWPSAAALLYPISATIYIAGWTPAGPVMVAGYGLANLGYLLFGAGIVAGSFRILGLKKRWQVFVAALASFFIGTVLSNVGA
jgi:hypothetical protein